MIFLALYSPWHSRVGVMRVSHIVRTRVCPHALPDEPSCLPVLSAGNASEFLEYDSAVVEALHLFPALGGTSATIRSTSDTTGGAQKGAFQCMCVVVATFNP